VTTYTQKVPVLQVFLKGSKPGPYTFQAAKIEETEKIILLKDGSDKSIGQFYKAELSGWVIGDDSTANP